MIQSGSVSNTAALINQLRIFFTATLPISERWTQLRYNSSAGLEELIVQGNGTGIDTIICGFKHYFNSGSANSEIILQHFDSFNNSNSFEQQIGGIGRFENPIALPAITSGTINYWFIGNSRHVKIILKIGTIYPQSYLGFGYPYANPYEWPNPVIIGGSSLVDFDGVPLKYNQTSFAGINCFWAPKNAALGGKFGQVGTLMIKNTNGSQRRLINKSDNAYDGLSQGTWPYLEIERNLYGAFNTIAPNAANQYHLIPIMIVDDNGAGIYGEFEGMRFAPPVLLPEDTIVVGGETWICFPNIVGGGLQMVAYRLV